MCIWPHPVIDLRISHELPQLGILDHILRLEKQPFAKSPVGVGSLMPVPDQALPHG